MSEKIYSNNEARETMNESFSRVTVRGTVIRKIHAAKSLIFAVASQNRDAKKTDYPRFVAFTNVAALDKTFSIGDRVTVEAYVYTSKKHPEGTLIPLNVRVEKNRLDAAFEKKAYLPDMNEFVLRGELAAEPYTPNNGTTVVTMKVNGEENTVSYIRTIAFGRAASLMAQKNKGDMVDAIGYIRTVPSSTVKDRTHTQSIVITGVR